MSKQLYEELINDLQAGDKEAFDSKLSELTDEQIDALFGEAQAFKSLGPGSDKKIILASVSNLRENYLKKLITTAMVGFLFQMKDEHTVDEDDLVNSPCKEDFMIDVPKHILPKEWDDHHFYRKHVIEFFHSKFPDSKIDDFSEMEKELSEDDLVEVNIAASEEMKKLTAVDRKLDAQEFDKAVQTAIQEQSDSERVIINKFLENLFKFDKDKHIQAGEHAIKDDPERFDINELKGTDPVYDNIPPNDTHCRFTSYYDINYEKMREATKNIYNVKPDLEHAMIVYDIVDSEEDAQTFIGKYGASSKYDILSFNMNKWTLLGSFKENRERVDYYNKHNSIIKALLEQQESDNVLAEDLMKKRVKSKKVKAEKIFGKDSEQFKEYQQLALSGNSYGSNVIENIGDNKVKVTREAVVDQETGKPLEFDEDGVPTNALEIPVTTINAKTGEVKSSRIFTRAEDKN